MFGTFFTAKRIPQDTLGIGVVLTIPGAGSEMSESSIITDENKKQKAVCDTEVNFPKFAILNPEVCYTIPDRLNGCWNCRYFITFNGKIFYKINRYRL